MKRPRQSFTFEYKLRVIADEVGNRKAGITGCAEDKASDESDISDYDEMESATALDPVMDAHLIDLFNSDTEDEDFNGWNWYFSNILEMNEVFVISSVLKEF